MRRLVGRGFGIFVVLYAVTACGDTDKNNNSGSAGVGGTAGFGAGGTDPQGQGGTTSQGQGGTDPQGQGGTTSHGQGGTTTQGAGGTEPQGQGGTLVGEAGASATGGYAGSAGDPWGGAAGATALCDERCEPCTEGNVHIDCRDRCLCENPNDPNKPDYDAMQECNFDAPCKASSIERDPGSAIWREGECLLTAFRDRTRGRYLHVTTTADLGTYTTGYWFLLGGDDNVLMLRATDSGNASGNLDRSYLPVWSCTLKSYEQLDACVAAGTDISTSTTGGGAAICDATEDWFESCETVTNPVCPGE
ncbi:MAG TPA: hypothetical protein VI197_07475 [Polyangiaceae bacterium]